MSERVKTNGGGGEGEEKVGGEGGAEKKGRRCESRSRESFLRRREGALNCEFK